MAIAIFLGMSTRPQNVAIVMVFLALGGVVGLTVAPYEIGTIRLAGVSLLWWYGALVAPLTAVALTVAALWRAARQRAAASE
jgi:putative solute:sodium symporter small subunit